MSPQAIHLHRREDRTVWRCAQASPRPSALRSRHGHLPPRPRRHRTLATRCRTPRGLGLRCRPLLLRNGPAPRRARFSEEVCKVVCFACASSVLGGGEVSVDLFARAGPCHTGYQERVVWPFVLAAVSGLTFSCCRPLACGLHYAWRGVRTAERMSCLSDVNIRELCCLELLVRRRAMT